MFQLSRRSAIDSVHVDLDPRFCSAELQNLLSAYRSVGLPRGSLTSEQTLIVMNALLAAWMLWACLVAILALLLLICNTGQHWFANHTAPAAGRDWGLCTGIPAADPQRPASATPGTSGHNPCWAVSIGRTLTTATLFYMRPPLCVIKPCLQRVSVQIHAGCLHRVELVTGSFKDQSRLILDEVPHRCIRTAELLQYGS